VFEVIWVEIPVRDIERAKRFYEAVFEIQASEVRDFGVRRTCTLYYDETSGKPGISLNQTANFEPGDRGFYVYLNAGDELSGALSRVEAAGGKVLSDKTSMGEDGNYAAILDSEGNQLALYSPS
jgi:predicted enzyme related to lactoylglutathione lyase